MTDKQPAEDQPQQVFVPVTATQAAPAPESEGKEEKAPKKKDDKEFPVGQVAAGGAGATVLGSYALASVVGPWGWAAAPAAAVVGGASYLAYRQRKKRGEKQSTKTTITRTRGSKTRSGSLGGLGGLRGRSGGLSGSGRPVGASSMSAKRSGGLPSPAAGKSSAASGSSRGGGAFRPGAGSSRGGGGWGAAGRRAGGGTTPRLGGTPRSGTGGGLFGRGGTSDTTASKRKSTPPNSGGPKGGSPRTGGSMPKNRWGTSPTDTTKDSKKAGRVRRGAAKARDWADDKTGRRMSTGWRAARDQKGFKARRRAAGAAVKEAGGGGIIAWIVGVIAALGAGIAGLFARSGKDKTGNGEETKAAGAEEAAAATGATAAAGAAPSPHPNAAGAAAQPNGAASSAEPWDDGEEWDGAPVPNPTTTTSTTNSGGTTMSGLPASQIAHDMAGAMARYEPADAYQVVPDSRQWADVPTQVAMSVKAYADRLEGARFPLNQAINDKLRDFAQAIAQTRSIAEEIEPLMRKAHADDLARKDSPRGDESKWNIH